MNQSQSPRQNTILRLMLLKMNYSSYSLKFQPAVVNRATVCGFSLEIADPNPCAVV